MTSFDKSADLSGWTDKYIRNPINDWLDKRVRKPVQRGFVQPMQEQLIPGMQQIVGESKESIRNAANPLTIPGHIKSEFGRGYQGFYKPETLDKIDSLRAAGMAAAGISSEFGKGYRGFYKPETLDKLNPLRSAGMFSAGVASEFGKGYNGYYKPEILVDEINPLRATGMLAAGVGDRWNHDYSTNADGTPNTNIPTFWTTAADTGRNMVRNLLFDSDMPGTTRLPFLGETKNSTIANVSALPASVAMYADSMLPKSWTAKAIPKIGVKKPVPIANMSDDAKYMLYKKIEAQKAKLYRDFMSTKPVRAEFEALPKDPKNPMTFNQFLNKRRPERWAEYVAKNKELSEKQTLIYPWLEDNGVFTSRTGTGTHFTRSGNNDVFGAKLTHPEAPMFKDRSAVILRNFGRVIPMAPRAVARSFRDGHWNSPKEQLRSFATDAGGDLLSNLITWGATEDLLPIAGSKIHPALGRILRENSSSIRNGLNGYIYYANQRDAFENAMGKTPEDYLHLPNLKSFFADKLHSISNKLPNLDTIVSDNLDSVENQGVYIPGRVNTKVQ